MRLVLAILVAGAAAALLFPRRRRIDNVDTAPGLPVVPEFHADGSVTLHTVH